MNEELLAYESILAEAAKNPGGDADLVAAAQEIVALDREWEIENGPAHIARLYQLDDLRRRISHTTANGIAGLRAKAVAARIHSNGFCSTTPDNDGESVADLAFSLAGDVLGLPHNRRLDA